MRRRRYLFVIVCSNCYPFKAEDVELLSQLTRETTLCRISDRSPSRRQLRWPCKTSKLSIHWRHSFIAMDPTFDPGVNSVQFPSSDQSCDNSLYKGLEEYPWAEDSTFLAGLASILSSQPPDTDRTQLESLALQVRCFYYNRQHNTSVDPTAYGAWRQKQNPLNMSPLLPDNSLQSSGNVSNGEISSMSNNDNVSSTSTALNQHATSASETAHPSGEVPQPASFAEIVALIQSGEPIPGIRDIPDTVLTGQGSESTQPPRRKPWERNNTAPTSTSE